MMRADEQNAGEFSVSAGGRLQRNGVHSGDFAQALLERLNDAQRTLGNLFRLIGMRVADAFEPRDKLVHTRVVLHRAGAERIHAEIDRIVPRGESGKVADDLDLAYFGHHTEIFANMLAK